jgi:hypothetical protein
MDTKQPAPITQEEALASLQEIDRVIARIRKAIASAGCAPMLILWGFIWIIGFGTMQFFPEVTGRLWAVLDTTGIVISILFGIRAHRSRIHGLEQGRIALSWLVLLAYGALWVYLLWPWEMSHRSGWRAFEPLMMRKQTAFWPTLCMFGYVAMGLWLDRFLLWLGVLVTVATLVGYCLVPDHFYLWIAATGGGSLVATGIFIRKFWK